jgi:Ca2+-binding EF-hand superfamily protein
VPGSRFHVPAARLPSELPDWFRQRDANGDGQITFAEFAAHAAPDELDDFARYDLNGDGVITVQEYLRAVRMKGQDADEGGAEEDDL